MKKETDKTTTTSPPRPEAYLPATIQKAVVRAGLQHPVTLYPMALGVSAYVVGALFNIPLMLASGIGLGLLGPVWAVSQIFFRHEALGSQYLEGLHEKQKAYEESLVLQIETGLTTCDRNPELKSRATTGISQLKSIRVKLTNVQELLSMKLSAGEITYGRFLGAAEQVALSVIDNLNSVAGLLKSATSIDPKYIQRRLEDMEKQDTFDPKANDQFTSLRERLDLWHRQLQSADRLMAKNEDAMTEMERISAAVAQWQPGRKFADNDFESAITQLQALALQAHEYDNI